MSSSGFRLALIQLAVGANKAENLARAACMVKEAVTGGAQMVVLPECFNSPYGTQYFKDYAESVDEGGPSTAALADMARTNSVHLVGGSIPERDENGLYNTATVWAPDGSMIAKHRKVHLFDIDVPGKIRFCESDSLFSGNKLTVFDTPFCRVGLAICYDIRFSDMATIYARNGCDLLVYPGAFNMTTGPAHWELLARARALDNQVYTAVVSPARDTSATYVAWGHSMVTTPWGKVMASAEEKETIVYADIDFDEMRQTRQSIPLQKQRRFDLYETVSKSDS